jgi:hypothetical protein
VVELPEEALVAERDEELDDIELLLRVPDFAALALVVRRAFLLPTAERQEIAVEGLIADVEVMLVPAIPCGHPWLAAEDAQLAVDVVGADGSGMFPAGLVEDAVNHQRSIRLGDAGDGGTGGEGNVTGDKAGA